MKFLFKFLKYVFSYRANTFKMISQEEMIETLTEDADYQELKRIKANNALRQINNLLTDFEKGGNFYAPIYKEIKEIVDNNVEMQLSDKILHHYSE